MITRMNETLQAVKRIDGDMLPFFGLRDEMRKAAFQVPPAMPQPAPMDPNQMAAQQGMPPQGPPPGAPMDPNQMAAQQGMPPQGAPAQGAAPISPEQIAQVLELLQAVAQKTDDLDKRLGQTEQMAQAAATTLQQHGQSLEDHDSRIAATATTQLPPQ